MSPEPAIVSEGRRLVQEAAARGLPVRLLGGSAIWLRASVEARAALGRDYPDLDLVAHRKDSRRLRDLLEELGYAPERIFNATHGAKRLLYHAPDGAFHVDVFLDEFSMSHTLDLGARLEAEPLTLTPDDLLLTKLQVAEVNRKDLSDAAMLLLDHEPAEHVARTCAADWGLHTTVTDNLARLRDLLPELLPDAEARARAEARVDALERRLEAEPKTRSWKLRARVGRRVRWYEVPEEVVR